MSIWKMSKTILVTRPNHDATTNFLYFWTAVVIEVAKKKGIAVLDLKEQKANKKTFDSYIKKNNPAFVFFNGHGSPELIFGYGKEILIQSDKDEELLSGKIVYSRTCDSANELGKKSVGKGVVAFIGYSRKFTFVYLKRNESRPLIDKIAKLFLEPSNLVATALLKGNCAKEAHVRGIKSMGKNLSYLLSSSSSKEERDAAPFLLNNLTSQVLHGNPNSKI